LLIPIDSIREFRKLRREITETLYSAGFVLAKWASNCRRVRSPYWRRRRYENFGSHL